MQIKIFKNLKQYTLTSSIKKDDLDLVKKYRPAALKKKDADGNDIFATWRADYAYIDFARLHPVTK